MSLLAQGSYGCVYYPGYSCKSKKMDKKYVSKLSRDDKESQVEYNMSKIVKKIPNYSKHFIVIERKCKVKQPKINKIKSGCEFIEKRDYPSYVLMYSKYLKSKELHKIIMNEILTKSTLIQLTQIISNRIRELLSVGIIHMDLHFANILVSDKNNRLYVIDFGLALDSNRFFIGGKINTSYIESKWHPYTTNWPSFCLEYIFISLIVKENQTLTKHNIFSTISDYYNNHKVLNTLLDKTYVEETYEYYKFLENNSSEDNLKLLISSSNTWDHYKLAYHILKYMSLKSIEFIEFKWLLLLMMHPIPTYRPTEEELGEHFKHYSELFQDKSNTKDIIFKD